MTVYSFTHVLVWDNLGGSVRYARGQRIEALDPTTCSPSAPTVGDVAPGLTQGGASVAWLTSTPSGHVDATATITTVRFVAPDGTWQDVTSADAITAAAAATDAIAVGEAAFAIGFEVGRSKNADRGFASRGG